MSIPLGAARAYMRRGWMPLLIAHQSKNPNRAGWQRFSTTRGELPRFFNGQPQNIDVLLGKPSGGLTDADLDCPESIALASYTSRPSQSIVNVATDGGQQVNVSKRFF
jgi:hypothetical protein